MLPIMKKEMNNMPKAKAPKLFSIKAKVDFELTIEAADKEEAAAWAEQVLPEIIKLETEYSDRILLNSKEIKVGTIKKVKV
jgi:hypothetical protein